MILYLQSCAVHPYVLPLPSYKFCLWGLLTMKRLYSLDYEKYLVNLLHNWCHASIANHRCGLILYPWKMHQVAFFSFLYKALTNITQCLHNWCHASAASHKSGLVMYPWQNMPTGFIFFLNMHDFVWENGPFTFISLNYQTIKICIYGNYVDVCVIYCAQDLRSVWEWISFVPFKIFVGVFTISNHELWYTI